MSRWEEAKQKARQEWEGNRAKSSDSTGMEEGGKSRWELAKEKALREREQTSKTGTSSGVLTGAAAGASPFYPLLKDGQGADAVSLYGAARSRLEQDGTAYDRALARYLQSKEDSALIGRTAAVVTPERMLWEDDGQNNPQRARLLLPEQTAMEQKRTQEKEAEALSKAYTAQNAYNQAAEEYTAAMKPFGGYEPLQWHTGRIDDAISKGDWAQAKSYLSELTRAKLSADDRTKAAEYIDKVTSYEHLSLQRDGTAQAAVAEILTMGDRGQWEQLYALMHSEKGEEYKRLLMEEYGIDADSEEAKKNNYFGLFSMLQYGDLHNFDTLSESGEHLKTQLATVTFMQRAQDELERAKKSPADETQMRSYVQSQTAYYALEALAGFLGVNEAGIPYRDGKKEQFLLGLLKENGVDLSGMTEENHRELIRKTLQEQGEKAAKLSASLQEQGYDTDTVYEYLKLSVDSEFDEFRQTEFQKWKAQTGTGEKILTDFLMIPYRTGIEPFTSAVDMLSLTGTGSDTDDPNSYVPRQLAQSASDMVREAATEAIEKNVNWELFGHNVVSFLYSAGMSRVDSAANAFAYGHLATLAMGTRAASAEAADILARGGSRDQAFNGGLAAGVIEALTEYFSVDKVLKGVGSHDSLKGMLKQLSSEAFTEATEEMSSEVLNIIVDSANMGNLSRNSQAVRDYMATGMSYEEASKQVLYDNIGQTAEAGASAIAGVLMGGGIKVGTAYARKYSALNRMGKWLQADSLSMEDMRAFVDTGLESAPDTRSYELAVKLQKKLDQGYRLSKAELAELYQANGEAIRQEELAQKEAGTEGQSTAVNDDPATHTQEEMRQIEEFKNAADSELIAFVQKVRTLQNDSYRAKISYNLGAVNERQAQDLRDLTGIDTTGYTNDITGTTISHIDKRHGVNGAADQSMADDADISRIGYVLQNYDSVDLLKNGDGTIKLSSEWVNRDQTHAKMVQFTKKVNGTYYVIEAVPDSSKKKLRVVSAYMQKKTDDISQEKPVTQSSVESGSSTRLLNIEENPLRSLTPETPAGMAASANGSIAQPEQGVKGESADALTTASKKYGRQAKAMAATYNQGQDVEKYDSAFRAAYDMGRSGVSFSYVNKSASAAYLTEAQREIAYEVGKAAAEERANAKDSKNKAAANGKTGRKRGGVVRGEGVKVADLRRAVHDPRGKAYKVLSTIAEVTGVNIVLYKSQTDADGNFIGEQGKFDPANPNEIRIDINAGLENISDVGELEKYVLLRTFSHEFTHFIEKWNPVRYNEFRRIVFDTLTERGVDVDSLIERKMDETGLSYEAASREAVADAMTDILPDSEFVEKLAQKHRTIFEKLLEKLKEFAQHIKDYFETVGLNAAVEANALKEQGKYLDSIVKLWDEIAVEAVETYQQAGAQKNTADEGGVMYSIRRGLKGDLEKVMNRTFPSAQGEVEIGNTSDFMVNELDADPLIVTMPATKAYRAMVTEEQAIKDGQPVGDGINYHGLGAEGLHKILEKSETPLAAFVSKPSEKDSRFDRIVLVTDEKVGNNFGVVIVEVESGAIVNRRRVPKANKTITVYDKINVVNAVQEAYANGRLLYIDKKNGHQFNSGVKGSDCPTAISESVRKKNIQDFWANVKWKKTGAKEMSFGNNTTQLSAMAEAWQRAQRKKDLAKEIDKGNSDALYQKRTNTLTDREVLVLAADELRKGDLTAVEKDALDIFEKRLAKLEDLKEKRAEQGRLYKEQQFGVKVDRVAAEQTRNRMQILDGQIERAKAEVLSIEDKKVLRQVLQKARKIVEKQQWAHDQETLQRYRERRNTVKSAETSSVGAAPAGFDPVGIHLAEAVDQYGAIPAGENAATDRAVEMPKSIDGKSKVSRVARSAAEANMTPREFVPEIEQAVMDGLLSYDPDTNKAQVDRAHKWLEYHGWEDGLIEWFREASRKDRLTRDDVAKAIVLYNNLANQANAAETEEERNKHSKNAIRVLSELQNMVTESAQMVQAMRIMKKQAPEMQYFALQRSVKKIEDGLTERLKKKLPDGIQLNEALVSEWMDAIRGGDESRIEAAQAVLYRDIAAQVPVTFREKWNTWRYLAMLLNPRTHIRNILGNAGFVPVRVIKDSLATGMEAIGSRISGGRMQRSKAVLNLLTKADRDLWSAACEDYKNVQELVQSGGKYNDGDNSEILKNRTIFKTRWLEGLRKLNEAGLDGEDMWFSKPAYATALAGYLKAHGISAEQFTNGTLLESQFDAARAYAVQEAAKATYRDTNEFSAAISKIGKHNVGNRVVSAVDKGLGILVEGVLPFKKTPANILVRGVGEYSPIGLIRGVKQLAWDVPHGTRTAAEGIDMLASGLTGTGLLALGVWACCCGLISGVEDDEKKRLFEQLMGHQNYALNIGNGSYTIDWLAPEALPVFVGVEIAEAFRDSDGTVNIKTVLEALSNISEPVLEMSMLSGLNDLLDDVSYSDDKLMSIFSTAATNYLTQFVPSIFGSIERTTEVRRYSTYADKENAFLKDDWQYLIANLGNKAPYEYRQIPFVDAWGREEDTGGVMFRMFSNFISPGYYSEVEKTPVDDELLRLYELGHNEVFPDRVKHSYKISYKVGEETVKRYLGSEEYVSYAKTKGQTSLELLSTVCDSSWYGKLDDATKAEAIKYVYDFADEMGKSTAVPQYEVEGWEAKAIKGATLGIAPELFIQAKVSTGDIAGLKDKEGNTISNSRGLLVMREIYKISGLTDKQRKYLFEAFELGKEVRNYSRAEVEVALREMGVK